MKELKDKKLEKQRKRMLDIMEVAADCEIELKEEKGYNPLDEAIEELKKKANIKIIEIDNDEPVDDEDCYGAD